MKISIWGCRGSIPVSGEEYVKYGGDTTCIEIRTRDDEIIIIDAGSGIRALGNKLLSENRHSYSMIFTHAHLDHVMGFPFLKPLYSRETHVEIFGCPFAQNSIKDMITRSMRPPTFPVDFDAIEAEIKFREACEGSFSIHSVDVTTTLLSHPNQGIGYKFVEDGKSFVFLTDNELTYKHPGGLDYPDYVKFASGADLLIHDAEYTKDEYKRTKRWGHSVYNDALQLAQEAGVKQFGLFHHNQDRSDTAVDEIVQDCRDIIKDNKSHLECFAVCQGMEIIL